MSYDIKQIIIDILLLKLKIKTLKTTYKIYKIKCDINNKKIKFKKLLKIKKDDVIIAIKFHNTYTLNDDKINAELITDYIKTYVNKIIEFKEKINPSLKNIDSILDKLK